MEAQTVVDVLPDEIVEEQLFAADGVDLIDGEPRKNQVVSHVDAELITTSSSAGMRSQTSEEPEAFRS